jgi:hypothetical protein
MMDSQDKTTAEVREGNPPNPAKSEDTKVAAETTSKPVDGEHKPKDRSEGNKKSKVDKCATKHSKSKHKKAKKHLPAQDSSSESSSTDSDDDSSDSDSESVDGDSDSEVESRKKRNAKRRGGGQKSKKKSKGKKKKRTKSENATTSDTDSDTDQVYEDSASDEDGNPAGQQNLTKQLQLLQQLQQQLGQGGQYRTNGGPPPPGGHPNPNTALLNLLGAQRRAPPPGRRGGHASTGRNRGLGGLDDLGLLIDGKQKSKRRQKASKLDFKRVDQVWDNNIHNYKLQDTAEGTVNAQYDQFLFHVRRTFDWEGKYKATLVDIKSKPLRESLQDVMGNIKGVSLVEETPKLDPNMLFLYVCVILAYLCFGCR